MERNRDLGDELTMSKETQIGLTSIITVNFNGGALLVDSVRSALGSSRPVEVLVADNGSTDNSIALLERQLGDDARLRILKFGQNLGFAKASNAAMARAQGDYILLLNPDCIIRSDTVARVVHALQRRPDAGMAGCLIRNPDGSEQSGARRAVPTPWRTLVRVFHLDKWMPDHRRFRSFLLNQEPLPDQPVEMEAISGAFMLARRQALAQVGLMDEGYFLHCEDLDWCMRFQRAGWKILFVPDAEAVHYKGGSSKDRPVWVEWQKHKGMVRFYNKFFRHQYPLPLMVLVAATVWARFAVITTRVFLHRALGTPLPGGLTVCPEIPVSSTESRARERALETAERSSFWADRPVLVTGGSGFIGKHLLAALNEAGAHATVLTHDRPVPIASQGSDAASVKSVRGDLADPATLTGVCQGMDTVFHLAGYAHAETEPGRIEQTSHWRVTVEGTRALLEQACAAGVKRFVFVSTVKAMGEGGQGCLDETSPAQPVNTYGRAKLEAERLVLNAGARCGMQVAILRLPMVYGCDNKGNLPRMIAAIDRERFPPLPEVHNKRSMVHVDDVVQALLLAAQRPEAAGQTYIVTDRGIYSTRQIYDAIRQALGKPPVRWSVPAWVLRTVGYVGDLLSALRLPVPLTSDTLAKLLGSAWYSGEKAQRELGYRPHHTLVDALPQMVAQYRANSLPDA